MKTQTREHLSGYTPAEYAGEHPPYISVNFQDHQVELTVRSSADVDGTRGREATIRLSWQDFWETMSDAAAQFQIMRNQSSFPIVVPSLTMKKRLIDLKREHDKHPFD